MPGSKQVITTLKITNLFFFRDAKSFTSSASVLNKYSYTVFDVTIERKMCLQLEPWYACNEVFRFLTAPKIKGQNSPWLAKLLFLVKTGFMVAQDHEHELSMHML